MRILYSVIPLLFGLAACQWLDPAPSEQSIVVFFDQDSASLDETATKIVTAAAAKAERYPSAIVHVHGYAAPDSGTTAYNLDLSRRRSTAVADGLAKAGVASSRIRIEPNGTVPFEMAPVESRRVEIIIGD